MFPVQAFGVPDPRMGEEMCACIRHREGVVLSEQQLRTFCREKVYSFQECGRPLLLATTLQYVTRRSRSHGTWSTDVTTEILETVALRDSSGEIVRAGTWRLSIWMKTPPTDGWDSPRQDSPSR